MRSADIQNSSTYPLEMPESVDIIIVNYNSTDHVLKCLSSIQEEIRRSRIPAKILIEDNASLDNAERIPRQFPDVLLRKHASNLGFSKAVNLALKETTAAYIILLNPDTLIHSGFLRNILEYMNENPKIGALGPRILNTDGTVQGSARAFPSPATAFFGRTSLLTRLFPGNKLSSRNIVTSRSDSVLPMEVDWVSGACMVVRRSAFEETGLMDERFFMYWEDADWCRRMHDRGWKILYFPEATVTHQVGGSSEKAYFSSLWEFHKSAYYLYLKHASREIPFIIRSAILGGLSLRFAILMLIYFTKKIKK